MEGGSASLVKKETPFGGIDEQANGGVGSGHPTGLHR